MSKSTASNNEYEQVEKALIYKAVGRPDHVTSDTHELIGVEFRLSKDAEIINGHSDWRYAEALARWMLGGKAELSSAVLAIRPQAGKFLTPDGVPSGYTSAYSLKIAKQWEDILEELTVHPESRRAYLNILVPEDKCVLFAQTTHEYPCTVGLHFFIRDGELVMLSHMRSQNIFKVMPYDCYCFRKIQVRLARDLRLPLGYMRHYCDSAHVYKRDFGSLPYDADSLIPK